MEKITKRLKEILKTILAVFFPRSENADIWKWKNFLGAVTMCCCLAVPTTASEPITVDHFHLHFVNGLNYGENLKRIEIREVESKLDRIRLYGTKKEPERDSGPYRDSSGEADGDPYKTKSKATIAREAKEKAKKEKRQKIQDEKDKTDAIALLQEEIKLLSEKPAVWTSPPIDFSNLQVGDIGTATHARFKILQIVDEETVIVIWGDGSTYYVKNIPKNSNLVDDDAYVIPALVIVDNPTRYETITGTKTIRTLRCLTSDEKDNLSKYVAKQLSPK